MVNKKYQCPNHCKVDHPHNVYFSSETGGIIIDEERLGKQIKEKLNQIFTNINHKHV